MSVTNTTGTKHIQKSAKEKIMMSYADDKALRERQSASHRSGDGTITLVISHKSKIKLVKEIQAKESRGWECAEPIKEQGGHYVAKMIFR